jgi:hypothetical protein
VALGLKAQLEHKVILELKATLELKELEVLQVPQAYLMKIH